ncbi:phenylacetate-CoA oxygenase subunit PaaJ [Providencia rettgeri]|uniref:1,2-phenylacetyl-CoA epoxidase subunit PaaD n=1 Tax=Providencia rettgeri TaxID=587 RepID=UPI00159721E4|nr:1,2-phenylacetyl-CoA epoxidase subunit PaaD [Providencia rettgeri]MBQ0686127.1 phenylacetate-CoA oxygenase subunit PaaJ [Providencia rettgeri]QKJ50833.1 phenylacetate-CoA oxygenase subunit PaaJ [Providencia rettgeri]
MEQRLKPNQLQSPQVHVIWQQLQQIPDPELPALSITDLGMIRNVVPNKQGWKVIFTPTYSGCPATEFLINEIKTVLGKAGFQNIDIEVMLTPAWTTDWMNQDAKRRLREFGIAPPQGTSCEHPEHKGAVCCPRCDSQQTEKISEFGSTACKALYRCTECLEPFDYFKCI